MKEELEKALGEEFPFMQRGLSAEEQEQKHGRITDLYGAFGIDTGDGWYPLLREMCAEIAAVYEQAGEPVDLAVDQVKEKFGTLRFYYHLEGQKSAIHAFDNLSGGSSLRICPGSSEVHQKVSEIVARYEKKSSQVCEVCGAPGCLRKELRWKLTLCDEHFQGRKRK